MCSGAAAWKENFLTSTPCSRRVFLCADGLHSCWAWAAVEGRWSLGMGVKSNKGREVGGCCHDLVSFPILRCCFPENMKSCPWALTNMAEYPTLQNQDITYYLFKGALFEQLSLMRFLMCLLPVFWSCLLLLLLSDALLSPCQCFWYNRRIVQRLPSIHTAEDEIQDQIHNMKGCSQWTGDRQCIYRTELTKTADLAKDNG